jgi:hypothetical protein
VAANPLRTTKKAQAAALRGELEPALEALLGFAAKGDVLASASAAQLLAFRGQWAEALPHAAALLANPDAIGPCNVFDDMVVVLERAGEATGDWKAVVRAAKSVPPPHDEFHTYYADRARALARWAGKRRAAPREEPDSEDVSAEASRTMGWEEALPSACALARAGKGEAAWKVLAQHWPRWCPVDWAQVAPVELLAAPELRPVLTPARCEKLLRTARGA